MDKIANLVEMLEAGYRRRTQRSLAIFQRAQKVMVKGGSHSIRLFSPYPFQVTKASGSRVQDVDGNSYIDYWQGHYANILGHNPEILKRASEEPAVCEESLHTGFEGESQIRLAEILLERLGYEDYRIRFTTSGTLATMYAVMVALGYTGREGILKIGGGWHGSSPFLLKGVKYSQANGFEHAESAGVSDIFLKNVITTRFNDGDHLERIIRKRGDTIGCFILEPFLGLGGFIAASREYLELARRLTLDRGIVLICDEIVSGFRFCPSGVQTLYGIQPDLSTFGKLIGGGHAVSAVAGKAHILDASLAGAPGTHRVNFEGGTYSSHPQYTRAGYVMLKHLVDHAPGVYAGLARAGETLRRRIEAVFAAEGIEAKCTGAGNDVIPGSSLFMVNFPLGPMVYGSPEDVWDPARSDVRLKEDVLKIALLAEGVHVAHGGGAISAAHTDADIEQTISAYGAVARLFKKHLY